MSENQEKSAVSASEKALKFTPQKVCDTLRAKHGIIAATAAALNCDRQTIYNYMQRFDEVRAAADDARETITDLAESKLFDKINEGEAWAICFYLKTQGKKRGYVEKTEVQHSGDADNPVAVKLVPDDVKAAVDKQFHGSDSLTSEI